MSKGRRRGQSHHGAGKSKRKEKGRRYLKEDDPELKNLNEQLAREGLKLHDVPGDGNCLFRALSDQLWLKTGQHHRHDRLRALLVQHMREYPDVFEPFMEEDELTYEEYLDALSKDGEFGGNDTIVAASRYFNCTVIIHQPLAPSFEVHSPTSEGPILHIAYLHGEHYSSVHPIVIERGTTNILPPKPSPPNPSVKKEKKIPQVSPGLRPMECIGETVGMTGMSDQIDMILQTTGCQDKELAEAVLHENSGDAHTAIIEILQLMELTDRGSIEEIDSLVKEEDNQEGKQYDQVETKITRHNLKPSSSGVRKPDQCPPPTVPKRHLSNRERKEQARRERKERRNEEKRKESKQQQDKSTTDQTSSLPSLKI